jgi:hypothetical protein
MEADGRAAGGERHLAVLARDGIGLGGKGEGSDPVRGGGPALVDGGGEAGEAAGQDDGVHTVRAFRAAASRRAVSQIQ